MALQAGGGLPAQRIMVNRTCNLAQAKERALRAAGVKPASQQPQAPAAE